MAGALLPIAAGLVGLLAGTQAVSGYQRQKQQTEAQNVQRAETAQQADPTSIAVTGGTQPVAGPPTPGGKPTAGQPGGAGTPGTPNYGPFGVADPKDQLLLAALLRSRLNQTAFLKDASTIDFTKPGAQQQLMKLAADRGIDPQTAFKLVSGAGKGQISPYQMAELTGVVPGTNQPTLTAQKAQQEQAYHTQELQNQATRIQQEQAAQGQRQQQIAIAKSHLDVESQNYIETARERVVNNLTNPTKQWTQQSALAEVERYNAMIERRFGLKTRSKQEAADIMSGYGIDPKTVSVNESGQGILTDIFGSTPQPIQQ